MGRGSSVLLMMVLVGCGSRTELEVRAAEAEITCHVPLPLDVEGRRMFVIDRSGSMNFQMSDDRTRWEHVSDTLGRALGGVPASVAIGAKVFPDPAAECVGDVARHCLVSPGVELELAANNGARLAELMGRSEPCGSTPLAAAVSEAAEELLRDGRDQGALIVVTDGAPNCSLSRPGTCVACFDTEAAEHALDQARRSGYPSHIVGIAIDRAPVFQDAMDRLATAGGLSRRPPERSYYDATDETTIQNVLLSLVAGVPSCSLTLLSEPSPWVRLRAQVLVGGSPVPHDPSRREGWDWTGPRDIAIYGEPCFRAEVEPAAVLQPCSD